MQDFRGEGANSVYSGGFEIEMAKGELQRSPSFLMVFIAFIVYRSPFHVNAMPNLSNGFSSSY